jgi:predicted DNA-binding transcriptional regulator AlpA
LRLHHLFKLQLGGDMRSSTPRFISLPEVSEITQLGKSTILAWEAQEKFPKAVRLSKTRRVWLEQDVHQWMLNQHAERITEEL